MSAGVFPNGSSGFQVEKVGRASRALNLQRRSALPLHIEAKQTLPVSEEPIAAAPTMFPRDNASNSISFVLTSTTATERTALLSNKAPVEQSRREFALMMVGIWSFTFISSLDGTIVATLLSTIGSSMQSMQLASWIGTSYLLALTASTPLYGRLTNALGRRPSIMFAAILFTVSTVMCGFATSMPQLVILRALAGIGGSGLTIVTSVLVSDVVPLKSRGLYPRLHDLVLGLGGAIGAPLGRALELDRNHDIPLATYTTSQVLGVSLSAALTQTLLARELRARIPDEQVVRKILASTAYMRTLPEDLKSQATASWMQGMHVVFVCQIVIAVWLLLSSLPIEELPLPDTVDNAKPLSSPAGGRSSKESRREA
ncbi:MFS general substrate transporter [Mycena chlorophos]|uniref:MFS general substrate transporter n=1 Tax=Mycena chlorophos TaxID=658473 RepID=A0A8H6TKK3_MYCCL|nr:MFS general substrate transporter [Mycena chlorophos]